MMLICFMNYRYHSLQTLTISSKMSLWWTWMVIRVSNLVLSTFVRFLVVWSIRVLSNSMKAWLVADIIFLSYLAAVSASVESLVQINWRPKRPTCAGNMLRNSSNWKLGSWIAIAAVRMTPCIDFWAITIKAMSQTSTLPSARTGFSNWWNRKA